MIDTNDIDPDYITLPHAEIIINDDIWHSVNMLSGVIEAALEKIMHDGETISILLTNDDHIQKLNSDFRGKDKPTNVLSFPSGDDDFIGDIAISFNTLEREAKEQDKDFTHHFIHILIHGVLHLKGYDHETDDEANEMEGVEIKILEDMGIKNPYT